MTSLPKQRGESRVLPAFAIVAVVAILAWLPGRYRLLPPSAVLVVVATLMGSIFAASLAPRNRVVTRVERYAVLGMALLLACLEVALLAVLLFNIVARHPGVDALRLLSTAVAVWVINVLVFALAYWQLDRGGPSGRANNWRGRADISFPAGNPSDGVPQDWQPDFVDYLFHSFSTATAFSAADSVPLTPRAKMLMMWEAVISLVTILAVAARAINILGS